MKRNLSIGAAFLGVLALLPWPEQLQTAAAQAPGPMAPRFEVDPTFPKPLPNGWYQGQSIGLWVDAQDHVWIVHRPDALDAVEGAADQKTPANAARRRRRFSSSISRATCCATGAGRMAPAMNGRRRTTG